ncbi:unnamed protein product [Caenorhabditis bovis]|uniref:Succinate dehydrogenase assembly factor 3 n=1 Tax=Caenorhabditis bovis TaxID=2654633 RepID=A0A8S1ECJ5_9PELO|nr:unnamed protein product [Caenorhabditis bovis]
MAVSRKVANAINPERFPLFLYKSILRLHYGLPKSARLMGDVYVKDEFRRHKNASPEFVKQFITEWTLYCTTLSKQLSSAGIRKGEIGMDLSPEKMEQLSNEHIGQLVELRIEADKHMGREDFIESLGYIKEKHEKPN